MLRFWCPGQTKTSFWSWRRSQYVQFRRCPSRAGVVQDPPWVHIFLNADVHWILSFGARPHFRPNPYYEDLERMEEAVMSILHNLEMENTEIHENNHELKMEMTFSRQVLVRKAVTCGMAIYDFFVLDWTVFSSGSISCAVCTSVCQGH